MGCVVVIGSTFTRIIDILYDRSSLRITLTKEHEMQDTYDNNEEQIQKMDKENGNSVPRYESLPFVYLGHKMTDETDDEEDRGRPTELNLRRSVRT